MVADYPKGFLGGVLGGWVGFVPAGEYLDSERNRLRRTHSNPYIFTICRHTPTLSHMKASRQISQNQLYHDNSS